MTDSAPIHDVIRILFRRKAVFVTVFFLAFSLIIGLLLIRRDSFLSEAKLFVRIGRESVTLDPTATTTGQTIGLRASRETEINSVVEMLKSRAIIEQSVDIIGPERILDKKENFEWVAQVKQNIGHLKKSLRELLSPPQGDGNGETSQRDKAISAVSDNIAIIAPEMTTVITISCEAQSPALAKEIVDTVVDVHTREHLRLNRTAGSEQFFHAQSELVRTRLCEARDQLLKLKRDKGIASIEAQFTLLERQKSELELSRIRNATQLHAARAKHLAIVKLMEGRSPTVQTQRVEGIADMAGDGMRQQLYDLEIRESELLAKLKESHPDVLAIRKQVADVRRILESQAKNRSESTYAIDPTWQQLHLDLLQEEARVAALVATDESLCKQQDQVVAGLTDLNAYALRHEDLQRQVDLLAANLKTYSQNLELARIDHALQQQRITNVNLVQAGTLPTRPTGPGKMLLACVGMMLATIVATIAVLVRDWFDRSLKLPSQVEHELSLPVLMSIPQSTQQRVRV